MQTCANDSQRKGRLLTIEQSECGQDSPLVFGTPACSHILGLLRHALDHGLQLLNQ